MAGTDGAHGRTQGEVGAAASPAEAPPWRGRLDPTSVTVAPTLRPRTKAWRLVQLMASNRREFADRVRGIAEVQYRKRFPTDVRYSPDPWHVVAPTLNRALGGQAGARWDEDDAGFASAVERLQARLRELHDIPFASYHDADPVLHRLCYFVPRMLKPEVVVETGVALGVGTAFALAALERNGTGRLVSIDLPPLGCEGDTVGAIVPPELRHRWTLHRGTSTRVLPEILRGLPPVGLFTHDSLFTNRNCRQEFSEVLPHLERSRSAIIANRIEVTNAFAWLAATSNPAATGVVRAQSKEDLIGIAVYGGRVASSG
jgi:hypothetical protein